MSEDGPGDKEQRSTRPVTAAARRERRTSARPTGKSGDTAKSAEEGKNRPAGKSGASPAKAAGKERPTPKRGRKDKKPSVVRRLARFIREVVGELRKVIWPTRKQMITYTAVVLVFVIFMVALVYGLDFVFRKGVFWLFT